MTPLLWSRAGSVTCTPCSQTSVIGFLQKAVGDTGDGCLLLERKGAFLFHRLKLLFQRLDITGWFGLDMLVCGKSDIRLRILPIHFSKRLYLLFPFDLLRFGQSFIVSLGQENLCHPYKLFLKKQKNKKKPECGLISWKHHKCEHY